VVVDIDYNILDADGNTVIGSDGKEARISYREVPLLSIPVMLRSKYCHLSNLRNLEALKECEYDEGGYFIIRGNPKVIVSQKTMRINVDIARKNDDRIDAEIRSLRADEKFRSTSTLYIHYVGNPPTFRIDIPFLAAGMPMAAIFRALGFSTQDEIEDFLWDTPDDPRKKLVATMYKEPVMNMTIDEVYTELGHGMYNENDLTPEKVRKQVQQQINGELLPHVGFDDEPETKFKKAIYLRSIMLHMLDIYTGAVDPDDRDFEGFKSIQMSASILSTMFRQMFSAFVKTIRNKMYDRFQKVSILILRPLLHIRIL
jgi:DNA-directed RNA polymerase II subunit RPB2